LPGADEDREARGYWATPVKPVATVNCKVALCTLRMRARPQSKERN
jgi:hypothetical protein